MTKIVVTGTGAVSPYGVGLEVLWKNLLQGDSGLRTLTSLDLSHVECHVGGQLQDFEPERYLPPRLIRRIDRFTAFGLVAAQEALQRAALMRDGKAVWVDESQRSTRVGVMVGTNLGGWEFAERELRNFWSKGSVRAVGPYMAMAWFPTAVQGNISIQFGIKGIGRTFLADRAGGAHALINAAECLQNGRADLVLAGGAEAPFSPYAALCYQTSGLMAEATSDDVHTAYRPFDRDHHGLVAAEGAAFLVLERVEDAQRRGAPILAEVAGWGTTQDGFHHIHASPDGKRFADAIKLAMQRASITAEELDCVFPSASAVPDEDDSEVRALQLALGEYAAQVPIGIPKSTFGHLFGAAFPMDVAIALLSMQEGIIPGGLHFDHAPQEYELDIVAPSARSLPRVDTCLLNARGIGGTNAALVLRRWQD